MKNRKVLQSSELCAIIINIKFKEDKSMNTFCMNSLRRKEDVSSCNHCLFPYGYKGVRLVSVRLLFINVVDTEP